MILKLIKAGFVSHEEPQNSLSQFWLLAPHDILDTDIVHIPVSQISLSGLVDSLQGVEVIVPLVFNISLHEVEFWDCASISDSFLDVIKSLW